MKDILDFAKRLWFVILMFVMVIALAVMMKMA
jgi:hypothetical protein